MGIRQLASRGLPALLRDRAGDHGQASLGYRVAHGALWSLAGAVLSRGLTLVGSLCAARMLDKEGFGQLAMIQSTVGMFGVFAGFGLGATATKHVAEYRRRDPERAGRIIGLSSAVAWITSALMTAALLIAAEPLARGLEMPRMADLLRLSAGMILLGGVAGAQTGALAGFEAFKTVAQISLVSGVLSFVFLVLGTHVAGLEGAVCALVANQLLTCILNYAGLRALAKRFAIPVGYRHCTREMSVLWTFSLPAMLVGLMVTPVVWISNKMLFVAEGGDAEMGLFQAANQWRSALAFLPSVVTPVMLPILVEAASSFGEESRRRLIKTFALSVGIVVVPTIILLGCSPWIPALYGTSYALPATLVALMIAVASVSNLGSVLFTCLQAINKLWLGFLGNLLWAITLLVAFYYWLPATALGLAWAYALGYAVSMLIVLPPIVSRVFRTRS